MRKWFRQLFPSSATAAAPVAAPAARAPHTEAPIRAVTSAERRASTQSDAGPLLSTRLVEFIEALTSPAELVGPEALTSDDILFLEGLIKRLESAQIEVAMLPDITLKLTELLRRGDVPVTQYVALINKDASLSMEVLKAANSAYYAATARTTSLHEAVMRLGQTRLQAILMLSLMKARVLRAGTLRAHAELLIDMAMPLASCAGAIAHKQNGPADLCFMRGMLLHIEHLLVLSTISITGREHRAVITPSTGGLMLAFARTVSDVRSSLAIGWDLEDLMLRREGDGDTVDYHGLRRAIACRWLRLPLPQVDGVPAERLNDLMSHVEPRVEPEDAVDDAPEQSAAASQH